MPLLRPHTIALLGCASAARTATRRHIHTTALYRNGQNETITPKKRKQEGAHGRTGGGEPLDSSSSNAPPQPKISNLSVTGSKPEQDMTDEQRKEVDEHNEEFSRKHDRSQPAPNDKVDRKYWSGESQGKP